MALRQNPEVGCTASVYIPRGKESVESIEYLTTLRIPSGTPRDISPSFYGDTPVQAMFLRRDQGEKKIYGVSGLGGGVIHW